MVSYSNDNKNHKLINDNNNENNDNNIVTYISWIGTVSPAPIRPSMWLHRISAVVFTATGWLQLLLRVRWCVRIVVHFRGVCVTVRDLWFSHHFVDGARFFPGLVPSGRPARVHARQHDSTECEQQSFAGHHDQSQCAQWQQCAPRHERRAHHVLHEIVFFPFKTKT